MTVLSSRGPGEKGEMVRGELGNALDAIVQESFGGEFWGSVLVARKGEVLLAKGCGLADHRKRSIGPDHLFDIGSVSKVFTAAAVLKLASKGKLELSDRLDAHFKDVPADERGARPVQAGPAERLDRRVVDAPSFC